jgi:nucleoside-diphosphate-sugar epimerase
MSRLICFGLGYCALHYIRHFGARFEAIAGTTREKRCGGAIQAFSFAPQDAALRATIAAADHVLVSIPPDETGDPVLREFATPLREHRPKTVYLSSLGVYGDYAGGWVDEGSPCRPATRRSRQRLHAEQEWTRFAAKTGAPVAILRLAGIYGPGRNALETVKRGDARRIVKPGQVFNRTHVFDIAQAIEAAFLRNAAGIFNVADDEPSPPGDPLAFAAQLLDLPAPPEVAFDTVKETMTPMALSFYAERRRATNTRMKSILGVTLRYPTYREGLTALHASGDVTSF